MNDNEIMSLLRSSPGDAHRALLEQYGKYVYAIVYNRLRSIGSAEDIEECVSDVFASLFLSLDRESINIKAMLGTIARNKAIDYYRSLRSRNRLSAISDEDMGKLGSGDNIEESSENKELREILLASINSLGEPDSTILIQKFYCGRRSADIAEDISMTASTVRSRCARAIKKLRSMLEAKGITV